jgi:hypothetical protein
MNKLPTITINGAVYGADEIHAAQRSIDKALAITLRHGQILHHVTRKNADGTPMRVRVTGKVKTWVRTPEAFKIPVAHGLYSHGYVTNDNAAEWYLPG